MANGLNPVTDPELLKQLEGEPGQIPVSDPKLIAQLEGQESTAKRAAGLTGRSLIEGALAIPGTILGGLYGAYNVGADLLGSNVPRLKDPNQQLSQTLTSLGLPEPRTGLEKVGNVAGQMIGSSFVLPVPKPSQQPIKLSQKDLAAQSAKQAGYSLPPSATGKGSAGMESFAGKAALNQEATINNQAITDALARRAASLPAGEEITKESLAQARQVLSAPYREVSAVSKTAAKALDKLGDVREEMNLAFNEYNRTASRQALKEAKSLRATAGTLEKVIDREAVKIGQPELLEALRQSRVALAKNFDVQRALNPYTGEVSAKAIGQIAGKKKVTDELSTIASFAKSFPKYAGEASKVPTPGVSALNPIASAGLGMGTAAVTGSPIGGWLAAGVPLARGPIRSLLLANPNAARTLGEAPGLYSRIGSPVVQGAGEAVSMGLLNPLSAGVVLPGGLLRLREQADELEERERRERN
jgi:hypothetical protein